MKICVIEPEGSQYDVLNHFSKSLSRALSSQGVEIVTVPATFIQDKKFLNGFDCTLSFNLVLMRNGVNLWDQIQFPHICLTVDSVDFFIDYGTSPYCIVTVRDKAFYRMFKHLHYDKVMLMYHAVDANLTPDWERPRPYPVVYLGSYFDGSYVEDMEKQLPEWVLKLVDQAVDKTLSDDCTPYHAAFLEACKEAQIPPVELAFLPHTDLMHLIEYKIRQKDRLNLIRSIKKHEVHIFGSGDWEGAFKDQPNVIIHPEVNFEEALEICRSAKIVLSSSPNSKERGHERVFYAYGCGACPLTGQNLFFKEYYRDRESILFYSNYEEIDDKLTPYLQDENLRQALVKKGWEITLQNHTWDKRAQEIILQAPPMIEKIKQWTSSHS